MAFRSHTEPSRRSLAPSSGVRRTEPGTLLCSTGSAGLPLRREPMLVLVATTALTLLVPITRRGLSSAVRRAVCRLPVPNGRHAYGRDLWWRSSVGYRYRHLGA